MDNLELLNLLCGPIHKLGERCGEYADYQFVDSINEVFKNANAPYRYYIAIRASGCKVEVFEIDPLGDEPPIYFGSKQFVEWLNEK